MKISKIDVSKEEFKSFPKSLDGQILLEIDRDKNGVILGWITCSESDYLNYISKADNDPTLTPKWKEYKSKVTKGEDV